MNYCMSIAHLFQDFIQTCWYANSTLQWQIVSSVSIYYALWIAHSTGRSIDSIPCLMKSTGIMLAFCRLMGLTHQTLFYRRNVLVTIKNGCKIRGLWGTNVTKRHPSILLRKILILGVNHKKGPDGFWKFVLFLTPLTWYCQMLSSYFIILLR